MGIFSIFKKKSAKIDMEHLPNHLAFIMDGNRRWARSRGLPTLLGHREGVEALKRVVRRAKELGIKNLSFYCFSTENFKRSDEEVKYLFDLFRDVYNYVDDIVKSGYRVHVCGDREMIRPDALKNLEAVEEKTSKGENGNIYLLIAYGGRHDIIRATQQIVKDKVDPDSITEESFKQYLSTKDMPDVDMIVRTSGENRISGFLLYNMAYAELYFVNKHWPSFEASDVDNCVREFQRRNRRFGG
ncbi:MAG: di-trans,poly-cis-decaprenylcistransferase [Clostridia bacterium]|nr:di-trans,poly-cis-decaprenylcistransferase [Clostridia bacterium]